MHAFTITSEPSRAVRVGRRVRACTGHVAAVALCLVLGAVVLVIRVARPLVNGLAWLAVRAEIEASVRTGMPPLASILGRRLVDLLRDEFETGWRDATTTDEGEDRWSSSRSSTTGS
ncbi:hypothetical protein [Streptomyces sp. NPDC054784]